jgi:hypothetical protein
MSIIAGTRATGAPLSWVWGLGPEVSTFGCTPSTIPGTDPRALFLELAYSYGAAAGGTAIVMYWGNIFNYTEHVYSILFPTCSLDVERKYIARDCTCIAGINSHGSGCTSFSQTPKLLHNLLSLPWWMSTISAGPVEYPVNYSGCLTIPLLPVSTGPKTTCNYM